LPAGQWKFGLFSRAFRSHLSFERNAPIPRAISPPDDGRIFAKPILGGLHHHYTRVA
jgi:hypothetical protein